MSWKALMQSLLGAAQGEQDVSQAAEKAMKTVRGRQAGASCQEYLAAVREALSDHEKMAELVAAHGLSEEELRVYLGSLQANLERELTTVRSYLSALQKRVEELTAGPKLSFELICSQCSHVNPLWVSNCEQCGRHLAIERGLWEQRQQEAAAPLRLGQTRRHPACQRFEELCKKVQSQEINTMVFSQQMKSLGLDVGNEMADMTHLPRFEIEHYLMGLEQVIGGLRQLQEACRLARGYNLDPYVLGRALPMVAEAERKINSGTVLLEHARQEYGLS